MSSLERIQELTRKDILAGIDKGTKSRAKLVQRATYLGVTRDYVVHMEVPSVTANPPTKYLVKVKLLEYPAIENEEDITTREKVRLALAGDVAISCSCPAFLYWGFDYIVSQLGSKVGDTQTIFPKVRNPELSGVLCKHAYRTISAFGSYWAKIAADIDSGNYLEVGG